MYPKKFEALIECFQRLPGVGTKTAERYAFEVLKWKQEEIQLYIDSFSAILDGIDTCHVCGNLSDGDTCEICKDQSRNHKIICVVQSPKDIIAMEKTQEYDGVYHVLGGVISTAKGIFPEDLTIKQLLERVHDGVTEIIMATNPTVEGETTALYIAKLLEKTTVNVTRIAHGLPMGGHLDYADELTLIKAMEGRKKIDS